jgi:hypothetical protein
MLTKLWSGNLVGGDDSEDLDIGGKIILEWISGKRVGKCDNASGLGKGPVTGSHKHSNEPFWFHKH